VMLVRQIAKRSIYPGSRSYFDWSKHQKNIFTKWTSKDLKDNTARLAATINKNYDLGRALPEQVEPIDWAYWKSVIKTPGVVDELKKKFDEIAARKVSVGGGEGGLPVDFESRVDKVLVSARRNAEYSRKEIKKLEPQLSVAEHASQNFENFTINDYYRRLSGVQREIMEDYDHGIYASIPYSPEENRKGTDLKPFIKAIQEGDSSINYTDLPEEVGDYVLAKEKAEVEKELAIRAEQVGTPKEKEAIKA